jgi:2-polyprenyl-3-methyl-5-hydroxy-6-metoxy-1,4-benzoquinol methylase
VKNNYLNNHIKRYLFQRLRLEIRLLERGAGPENDRFSYQRQHVDFDIKPGETVLDIGSGGDPFPMATHLADLYEGETTHRTDRLVRDHRPLVICDIEETPFRDKEYDFVYCSHVLEHVNDPGKACREIMRIGKRGYIETPSRSSDIMFNFTRLKDHHKWFTNILGNTIVFMEWSATQLRDMGSEYYFEQYHSEWNNEFQIYMRNNRQMFVNMFLWNSDFDYFIIDSGGKIQECSEGCFKHEGA